MSVGFNRRFAPLSLQARDRLAQAGGNKYVLLRVNAGQLPEDLAEYHGEGNGRILGEVCHFVDLARFLIGNDIKTVQAAAASVSQGVCDDLTVSLNFADGASRRSLIRRSAIRPIPRSWSKPLPAARWSRSMTSAA